MKKKTTTTFSFEKQKLSLDVLNKLNLNEIQISEAYATSGGSVLDKLREHVIKHPLQDIAIMFGIGVVTTLATWGCVTLYVNREKSKLEALHQQESHSYKENHPNGHFNHNNEVPEKKETLLTTIETLNNQLREEYEAALLNQEKDRSQIRVLNFEIAKLNNQLKEEYEAALLEKEKNRSQIRTQNFQIKVLIDDIESRAKTCEAHTNELSKRHENVLSMLDENGKLIANINSLNETIVHKDEEILNTSTRLKEVEDEKLLLFANLEKIRNEYNALAENKDGILNRLNEQPLDPNVKSYIINGFQA